MIDIHRLRQTARPRRQQGVALAVALILLVITTLIALSAGRFTALEVRQATNFETVRSTQQSAQSVVDAIIASALGTPVTGGVGEKSCKPVVTGCLSTPLALSQNMFAAEFANPDYKLSAQVERLAPLLGPPPRGTGYSRTQFDAAFFRVRGEYDASAAGRSRATVEEGFIILVGVGQQGS